MSTLWSHIVPLLKIEYTMVALTKEFIVDIKKIYIHWKIIGHCEAQVASVNILITPMSSRKTNKIFLSYFFLKVRYSFRFKTKFSTNIVYNIIIIIIGRAQLRDQVVSFSVARRNDCSIVIYLLPKILSDRPHKVVHLDEYVTRSAFDMSSWVSRIWISLPDRKVYNNDS